ncbi:MAG: glycosyltransferase [Lachnospiraceae bacterium]|nr:glycosyltransferase [Lachnospiraceae bacterium]
MKGKKKIAILISSLNRGGAERAASELSLNWPEGWDIDFILNNGGEVEYPYRGSIIDLGIKARKNKLDVFYQLKVFLIRILKLRMLKEKNEYTACISFMDSANIANILSGRRCCRVIGTVHTNLRGISLPQYKYLVHPAVRLLYNRADHIVGVSKDISRDLVNYFKISPQKVSTINNGYDTESIRKLAAEEPGGQERHWLQGTEHTIVTMGRLDPMKAQWHLIRAMKKVKESYADARLLILGEGQLREGLQGLIRELGLEDSIILCGVRENPFRIVSRCRMFALSSVLEGFPNVLPEAMCCGIPCVSTDFRTGVREIMDPHDRLEKKISEVTCAEYGILSPVCDGRVRGAAEGLTHEEELLAEAVCLMLGNDKLQERYRALGRERSEALSVKKSIGQYLELAESADRTGN